MRLLICAIFALWANTIVAQQSAATDTVSGKDSTQTEYDLSLEEVMVVGKAPTVRLTNEKSVYNVSDMSASQSGSLKELLRTIPSLTVDFSENVLLNGAPVRFLIDGQEVSGSELAAYSPSQIASIEVIANPTSKYDASGLSGIVQLISKRNRASGISGRASLAGAHYTQVASAGVNYNLRKFNVSGNLSHWKNDQHGSIETLTDDHTTFSNQVKADVTDMTGNLKLSYGFNPGSTLFLSYQYLNFSYLANDSSSKRVGQTDMKGITHQFATGYSRELSSKGESLKANFYYNSTSPTTYSVLDYTTQRINIVNTNRNNSWVGTLDYFVPFTESTKLEAGVKSHTRHIAIYRTDDFSGAPLHDTFKMTESILAGYVLMNSRVEKFNVQVGVRGESNLAGKTKVGRRWDFFSNILLSYAMDESNLFSLGYSKRINRPSAADINPFMLLIDPTSRLQGNPDLLPEYSHNLFLDYTSSFRSNKLKVSAYYKRIKNLITKTYENTGGDNLYTPVNIPSAHFYGIDLSTTHHPGEWLMLQPSAGVLATHIPYQMNEPFKQNASYYLGLTLWIKLPHHFSIQALAQYTSKSLSVGSSSQSAMVQGLAIGKPQLWSELSLSKSIMKENLNFSLRATDPFRLMRKGYRNYSGNLMQETLYHLETRFIYLGIAYRFNNHKASRQNYEDGGIKVF